MSDIRFYYGVVIDDTLKGVRQYLHALAGAAQAEAEQSGADKVTRASLQRLESAIEALDK